MKKEYKYYIFYIKEEYIDDLTCLINDSCVYAYTNDKKIAKEFIYYHDMSKFNKETKMFNRDELNQLFRDEQQQLLKLRSFSSSDDNGKLINVQLPITQQEERHLDMVVLKTLNDLAYIKGTQSIPPSIFTDKVIKLCEKFKMFTIFNNYRCCRDNIDVLSNHIRIDDGKEITRIIADEVAIYVHLFGMLLNENI